MDCRHWKFQKVCALILMYTYNTYIRSQQVCGFGQGIMIYNTHRGRFHSWLEDIVYAQRTHFSDYVLARCIFCSAVSKNRNAYIAYGQFGWVIQYRSCVRLRDCGVRISFVNSRRKCSFYAAICVDVLPQSMRIYSVNSDIIYYDGDWLRQWHIVRVSV